MTFPIFNILKKVSQSSYDPALIPEAIFVFDADRDDLITLSGSVMTGFQNPCDGKNYTLYSGSGGTRNFDATAGHYAMRGSSATEDVYRVTSSFFNNSLFTRDGGLFSIKMWRRLSTISTSQRVAYGNPLGVYQGDVWHTRHANQPHADINRSTGAYSSFGVDMSHAMLVSGAGNGAYFYTNRVLTLTEAYVGGVNVKGLDFETGFYHYNHYFGLWKFPDTYSYAQMLTAIQPILDWMLANKGV